MFFNVSVNYSIHRPAALAVPRPLELGPLSQGGPPSQGDPVPRGNLRTREEPWPSRRHEPIPWTFLLSPEERRPAEGSDLHAGLSTQSPKRVSAEMSLNRSSSRLVTLFGARGGTRRCGGSGPWETAACGCGFAPCRRQFQRLRRARGSVSSAVKSGGRRPLLIPGSCRARGGHPTTC